MELSADYDPDLTIRENLTRQRTYAMVTIARLERVIDTAQENISQQYRFIELFKQRYPKEYEETVTMYADKVPEAQSYNAGAVEEQKVQTANNTKTKGVGL